MLALFRTFDRPALPARALSVSPDYPSTEALSQLTHWQQLLLRSSQHPPRSSPQLSAGPAAARTQVLPGDVRPPGAERRAGGLKPTGAGVGPPGSDPGLASPASSGRLGFLICKVGTETELNPGSAREAWWPGVPALRGAGCGVRGAWEQGAGCVGALSRSASPGLGLGGKGGPSHCSEGAVRDGR